MIRLRTWYWLVGILMIAAILAPSIQKVQQTREYAREQIETAALIEQLEHRVPPGVESIRWKGATGWARTAFHNVCFSHAHVPLAELKAFRAELQERLQGPIDLRTVDWIWDRLRRTGSHGQMYIERYDQEYQSLVHPSPKRMPVHP